MFIDIPYFIILLFAIYKGYNRGLIVAVFSFLALIVGLAAAIKLSAFVANWLQRNTHIGLSWLPVLSFLVVFIGFVALIRLAAGILRKSVELLLMGWADKLGGILLYAALFTMIFSVLLFYAIQLKVLTTGSIGTSKCYGFVKPWASFVINGIGKIFPVFKGMFSQLEDYFQTAARKL
jgi:membrane protein required for colicin V production